MFCQRMFAMADGRVNCEGKVCPLPIFHIITFLSLGIKSWSFSFQFEHGHTRVMTRRQQVLFGMSRKDPESIGFSSKGLYP